MAHYDLHPVTDRELIEATRLCFPALPRFSWQAREVIRAAPEQLGVDFHRQIVARGPGGLAATCLYVLMPGHGAAVIAPQFARHTPQADHHRLTVELVRAATAECRSHGAVLIQSLLEPSLQTSPAGAFLEAGFSALTTLIYMERPADDAQLNEPPFQANSSSGREHWEWTRYADHDEETIGRLIERTYVDTLDCPELERMRTWRDVIDSHKGSGIFSPHGWSIASLDGQPAGLALVNRMVGREACELVYMGVSPQFRGRGLGQLLLQQALENTRLLRCPVLTLAVDERNGPALKVYRGAGFRETMRRLALIVRPTPA